MSPNFEVGEPFSAPSARDTDQIKRNRYSEPQWE